jgi:multimeric flavodoxin WrbA
MNLLIVLGSRSPEGQTAQAANALAQGAADAGWESELLFLPQMAVEQCRQCDERGWGLCRSDGRCVVEEDDFRLIVNKIREADAVSFCTPVYFGDLSESLRAFTDRLRRITRHEDGQVGIADKRAIGVCVAGGGGGGGPSCTVSLERVLRTSGFDVVDMVPVRRQNLGVKTEVLRITGKWLAGG